MSLSRDERSEIASLISQLESGGLNDSGKQRLADLMRDQPDAIDVYLDQCDAEAMLRETYGSLHAVSSPIKRKQPPSDSTIWRLAIAALILLAVGVGFGQWWAGSRTAAKLDLSSEPESRAEDAASTHPIGAVVATVARNSGTQLLHESGLAVHASVGDEVHASQYKLSGGVLELKYESGATVILESPATVELQSNERLRIVSGRLSVRCPTNESKGFVVETPSGMAIDLGTEFAVDVDPNGVRDDEYHVFTGEVEIKHRSGGPDVVPVKEGQALRLDRDTSTPTGIDVDHQRFIRDFNAASTDYYDRILSLDPAVYYVMRAEQDGRTLRNEVNEQAVAMIHSTDANHLCYAPGINGGTAFHLDGINTYAVAQDYPKSTDDRLSVVAWVYAESRPSWASIAKNWGHGLEPNRRGQFHFGLHKITGNFRGSLEAHINDNDNVEQSAIEPTPIPLNRWHHVAMVADGSVLRLYRNGNEVAATAYNGLNGNQDIKALAIGTKLDDSLKPAAQNPLMNPVSMSQGFWDGSIDHLSIFNSALTPEQIMDLYEAGDASMRDFRGTP
ncbi:MAG: LamG-like jellyroll fold domain-containing protein [Rubripirellula sp.]